MDDLAAFLLARISEDEATARAAVKVTEVGATAGWYWSNAGDAVFLDGTSIPVACGPWRQPMDQAWAFHIVRHDPERVLAECDAKRRIVTAHRQRQDSVTGIPRDDAGRAERHAAGSAVDDVLRFLALPYADHRAYRPEWRP